MKKFSKKKKFLLVLLIVVLVLTAIRLALPSIVLHYANKTLAHMKGYRGHIRDIDIALIRGAYKIDSVYLNKVDSTTNKETPFFAASTIDLSIEWKALFHGSVVGEAIFDNPMLRFTKDKVEPHDVRKDSSQLKSTANHFMPLDLNRFEIRNGSIQYIDENSHPKVDVTLTHAHVVGTNLRNSYDSSALLPATITAQADVYEGTLSFNMKINPLAKDPTFDVNAELLNTNMVKLNDFFQAYAKVDISHGTFGLYTEAAAKDGRFNGYVKPVIKDLKVLGKEDKHDNILRKIWEGFAGLLGNAFKNQPHDRLATKIPFEGDVHKPNTDVWYAVGEVLKNAFVRALEPSLDQDINIATVTPTPKAKEEKKGFFKKLFGKKKDKRSKETAKKDNDKKKG